MMMFWLALLPYGWAVSPEVAQTMGYLAGTGAPLDAAAARAATERWVNVGSREDALGAVLGLASTCADQGQRCQPDGRQLQFAWLQVVRDHADARRAPFEAATFAWALGRFARAPDSDAADDLALIAALDGALSTLPDLPVPGPRVHRMDGCLQEARQMIGSPEMLAPVTILTVTESCLARAAAKGGGKAGALVDTAEASLGVALGQVGTDVDRAWLYRERARLADAARGMPARADRAHLDAGLADALSASAHHRAPAERSGSVDPTFAAVLGDVAGELAYARVRLDTGEGRSQDTLLLADALHALTTGQLDIATAQRLGAIVPRTVSTLGLGVPAAFDTFLAGALVVAPLRPEGGGLRDGYDRLEASLTGAALTGMRTGCAEPGLAAWRAVREESRDRTAVDAFGVLIATWGGEKHEKLVGEMQAARAELAKCAAATRGAIPDATLPAPASDEAAAIGVAALRIEAGLRGGRWNVRDELLLSSLDTLLARTEQVEGASGDSRRARASLGASLVEAVRRSAAPGSAEALRSRLQALYQDPPAWQEGALPQGPTTWPTQVTAQANPYWRRALESAERPVRLRPAAAVPASAGAVRFTERVLADCLAGAGETPWCGGGGGSLDILLPLPPGDYDLELGDCPALHLTLGLGPATPQLALCPGDPHQGLQDGLSGP